MASQIGPAPHTTSGTSDWRLAPLTSFGTSDWLWHPRLALAFQAASGTPDWFWHFQIGFGTTGFTLAFQITPEWHLLIGPDPMQHPRRRGNSAGKVGAMHGTSLTHRQKHRHRHRHAHIHTHKRLSSHINVEKVLVVRRERGREKLQ